MARSGSAKVVHAGWVRWGFQEYYAPLLLKPAFKVVVLAAFAAIAALSIFGITRLQEGQPLQVRSRISCHSLHFP